MGASTSPTSTRTARAQLGWTGIVLSAATLFLGGACRSDDAKPGKQAASASRPPGKDSSASKPKGSSRKKSRQPTPARELASGELDALATYVAAIVQGHAASPPLELAPLANGREGVSVSLRSEGALTAEAWAEGEPIQAVPSAVQAAVASLDPAQREAVDSVILELAHDFVTVSDENGKLYRHLRNAHRGVRGFELVADGTSHIVAPTQMLVRSTAFDDELARLRKLDALAGLDDDAFARETTLRRFEATQIRVALKPEPSATVMFRGNTVIPKTDVDESHTRALAERAGAWLVSHVGEDGRTTYTWHPSRGEEATDNNMIRQWMASVCLARWARFTEDPADHDAVERNLAYNLEHFYQQNEEGLGWIEYRGGSKLGSIALAALAIHESSVRERYAEQEASLYKTIQSLWRDDGSFVTHFKPAGKGGGNNYYPGEALVYIAKVYDETRDPVLLERFMASFRYYRAWHLEAENRSPPFVPWHTQAYYTVWTSTRDRELQAFMFKMNDWLIDSMQVWEDAPYPDAAGQFYSRRRTQWGSENASSTGVYIEGIADVFAVAKKVGDVRRSELYARSLSRALLHLYHIQIVDDIDTFYMIKPERAIGGIRTSMYRDFIRVDNVQHNLMGVIKILKRFTPSDYHTERPS